jgi:eukaryotic-like serine/threonine-protein kinase
MGSEASLNLDVLLAPGAVVGDYVVQRKLGEGGMGAVFAARHPLIGKRVAIKVLSPSLASSPEAVERFIREARSVNEIGHRNIVDIFGFGQLPMGLHYYVMEHLDGRSLHDELLRLARPLTLPEIHTYMRPVFSALSAAHARGVVHRDLKPENIYVVDQGTGQDGGVLIKLLDFGIAKLATDGGGSFKTRTGVPMGTPYYMSPEQCLGRGVDQRTDIYALGIILYQMVTGRLPFSAESYLEVLQQQLHSQAEPPGQVAAVPQHVERAIQWAMQKDAALRPQTVDQLWEALEGKAATVVQPAPTLAASAPAPSLPGDYFTQPGITRAPVVQAAPASRRWWPVAAAAAVVVVGLVAFVALRPRAPAPQAAAAPASAPAPAHAPQPSAVPPPTAAKGILRVDITPADAKLTLDGAAAETASDVPVAVGTHRIRLERGGFSPLEQSVEVAADRRVGLQLSLQPVPAAVAAPAPPRRVRATHATTPKARGTKLRDKDDTARPSWMDQ